MANKIRDYTKACRRHLCRRRQGQYPQRDPLCHPPASGAEGNTLGRSDQTDLRDARRHQGDGKRRPVSGGHRHPCQGRVRSTGPAAGSGQQHRCRAGSQAGPRQPHHRHHVRRVRTLCVHSGRSRSGARRTDHHYPLLPRFCGHRYVFRAQLHQLDALHLPAGHDRRHCFQALQV